MSRLGVLRGGCRGELAVLHFIKWYLQMEALSYVSSLARHMADGTQNLQRTRQRAWRLHVCCVKHLVASVCLCQQWTRQSRLALQFCRAGGLFTSSPLMSILG